MNEDQAKLIKDIKALKAIKLLLGEIHLDPHHRPVERDSLFNAQSLIATVEKSLDPYTGPERRQYRVNRDIEETIRNKGES